MGLINIYDTVSNDTRTIKANGKLKNIITDIDFNHSLVLKAGNRLSGDYEVQPDDVLYVRKIPASTAVVAGISIAIALIAIGVGVGTSIYANKKSEEAKAQMEKAQRNAQNMAAAVQQLPYIRGSKNRKALGEAVQFVMGSVYNTPYNVTDGYYSIDGNDGVNFYYNAVFSAGYGSQKITQLLLGNENICHDDNGISGTRNFDASSLYYDSNNSNIVEVRQPGDAITIAEGNQKVSATFASAELKHEYGQDAEPVIVQAAENAMKIQVCIQFSCLRQYDSEAETWKERTATVRPYWSNDGGANWHEFSFAGTTNNTFTKNSNKNIRYVATKIFTAAESFGKNISIKVVKDTPKAQSGSQEDCQLLWYQTFQYDALKSSSSTLVACTPLEPELYNKVTRIAYRVIASDTTQNIIDELHAMSEGYARTWDGTAWSLAKETTRNPAAWLVEVLTSDIHLPSKFDSTELYLPSFGELYKYCADNGFYCDGIITASEKKLDIINKILNICNASLIRNQDGLLEVVIDKEEENPVALLNAENIVSFSASKSMQKKTDGTKVTYTNRNSWAVDTFYSMLDGGSYDYTTDTVDTLALEYVTTYEHAYKMAQRKLRQRQLQPREIKADIGSEGDWYPLYSTVLLQLPHLLQGLASSVIKGVTTDNLGQITHIQISDAVQIVENSRYGVVIQATNSFGFKLYAAEVEGVLPEGETEGITRTLSFPTPLDVSGSSVVPELGNHLSFGLLDSEGQFTKITNVMKIYGVEPNGSDGYTLTLRDYNEDVYSYGGAIPAYKSNVTRPQASSKAVSVDDIANLRQDMNVLQEDLINAYQMLEMPIVVDADVKSVVVETDENGKTAVVQTVETQVTCQQGWEDRPFVIGTINVPAGWTYQVVGGKVIFTIGEGAVVRSGQFKIPVIYRPVVLYEQYVDEDGNSYVDENAAEYMSLETASTEYTYDIWFSYFGLSEGVYLGVITSLQDIPSTTNLNNYFVWGGADTVSTLSIEGKFKQARTYKYIGPNKAWKWEVDSDLGHGIIVMGDVFGIAGADLQNNNSQAWEYLNHLTANSIYVDMLVANTAFINQLTSKIITVGDLLTVGDVSEVAISGEYGDLSDLPELKPVATSGDYDDLDNLPALKPVATSGSYDDLTDKPTIPDVSNLADKDVFAQKIGYANYADLVAKAASSEFGTIIQNGLIRTSLIDADVIWADILAATSATFTNLSITGTSFFQGLLDCGVLQVVKRTLTKYLFNYSPASGMQRVNDIYNYLRSIGFDGTERTVGSVLSGYSGLAMYYGSELINTVRIEYFWGHSVQYCHIILNGVEKIGYYYSNEIPEGEEEEVYYEIWQTLQFYASYTIGTTMVKLTGLPTEAPSESGLMWVDGNTLKIS